MALRGVVVVLFAQAATAGNSSPLVSNSVGTERPSFSLQQAPARIAHPILFVHGIASSGGTWDYLVSQLVHRYQLDPALDVRAAFDANLNLDGDTRSNNLDVWDEESGTPKGSQDISINLNRGNKTSSLLYRLNFRVGGVLPWGPDPIRSNSEAIIKQAKVLGEVMHFLVNDLGHEKVIVVGHSMGGLAARMYLQWGRTGAPGSLGRFWVTKNQVADHYVAKLVTIGTPHNGSLAADFGLVTVNDPTSNAARDLTYDYNLIPIPRDTGSILGPGNGVFLYGGPESDVPSIPVLQWGFESTDVDSNGQPVPDFPGLNHPADPLKDNSLMPLPSDVEYVWLVGDRFDNPDGDGLVRASRQYLSAPGEQQTIQACHVDLIPDPVCSCGQVEAVSPLVEALDEPDWQGAAWPLKVGKRTAGFTTYQQIGNPTDVDFFSFEVRGNGVAEITLAPAAGFNSLKVLDDLGQEVTVSNPAPWTYRLEFSEGTTKRYYVRVEGNGVEAPWDEACNIDPNATGDSTFSPYFLTLDLDFSTTVRLTSPSPVTTLGGTATLTAVVSNANGGPIGIGEEVVFSPIYAGTYLGCVIQMGSGCLATTNSAGIAEIQFASSAAGVFAFTATASSGGSDTATITVAPGQLALSANPNPVDVGSASRLAASVFEASGAPVGAGLPVTFSTTHSGSFQGNGASSPFSPSTVLTDANGETWVNFTGWTTGLANLTVSVPGVTPQVLPVQINPLSTNINVSLAIQPQQIGQTSSTYRIEARVTDLAGVPIGNERVDFTTSAGTLSTDWDITGSSTGTASTNLTVTSSGNVLVTATARGVPATTVFYAQVGAPPGNTITPVRSFSLGTAHVWGLEFSPDGSVLIAGNENQVLTAWNTSDWSERWSVTAEEDNGAQVSISPDSTKVLFTNRDGTELFQVSDGAQLCGGTVVNPIGRGIKATFTSNSTYIDTGRVELMFHSSLCDTGLTKDNIDPDQFWEYSRLAHYSDGQGTNLVVTVSRDGFLHRWNGFTGNPIGSPISVAGDDGGDASFSSDGSALVALGFETVKVFDTSTWSAQSFIAAALTDEYYGATFLDNDTKIAIGAAGKMEILNYPSGTSFAVANIPGSALEIDWNPSTEELAVGTRGGGVLIFKPLDFDPPVITLTSPPGDNFATNMGQLTTTGTVTDASGIASFTINGLPVSLDAQGGFSHDVNLLPGPNVITYEATDTLGHTVTFPLNVTLLLDTTPPVISGVAIMPLAGPEGTQFSIQATVVDGDTGVASVTVQPRDATYVAVGSPIPMALLGGGTYEASFDSTGLATGFYSIDITAIDSSSQANVGKAIGAATFSIAVPCYTLSLGHIGDGGDPTAMPIDPQLSDHCPVGEYAGGQSLELKAGPAPGWTVRRWSGTDDDASRQPTNTVTMPLAPHAVVVEYVDLDHLYYVLDGFGEVHPGGASFAPNPPTPFFGTDFAVDIELAPTGFYVLDLFGGVHAGGGAPLMTPPSVYFGFPFARDLELGPNHYYVLDSNGVMHGGGGAPTILVANIPPDVETIDLEFSGSGYYMLDNYGTIYPVGGAAPISPSPPYFGFDTARDLEFVPTGGVYVLDGLGVVHAGGGAGVDPATAPPPFLADLAEDLEIVPTGYYILDAHGGIHAGGGAPLLSGLTVYFGFDIARDLELR